MAFNIPLISDLRNYNRQLFSADLSAGLTVGIMLVPQGMAYAMLAGLPPVYGLYASIIPLIVYAILGTSRQLAVGPVAMVSLLVATGLSGMAAAGSTTFIAYAILLSLLVGVIQILMSFLKAGNLVAFLSHPVLTGFTTAAAIIIGLSQMKHLLGVSINNGKFYEVVQNIIHQFSSIHLTTLGMGILAIVVLFLIKKSKRNIPGPLIIVVLGSLAVFFLQLNETGVQIIEDVPGGLPALSIPSFSLSEIKLLLPTALTIALISYMESFAVAKVIRERHKNYDLDANQELLALGSANLAGAFFSAFPTTGGFSRSAVNDQAGAQTSIASIFSALLVLVTLLFLTPFFYYLPKVILAAIILVAVAGLINFKEIFYLWKYDKIDFAAFLITALCTLFIGVEQGILLGVVFSMLIVVFRVSQPHIAELAQVPNSSIFRNVKRFDNLIHDPKRVIIRPDAQLFFANIEKFNMDIIKRVDEDAQIEFLIIEAGGIHHIDTSAIHLLYELNQELRNRNIQLLFSEVKGPLRDKFNLHGLFDEFGKEHFFLSTIAACKYIDQEEREDYSTFTFQTNN